MTAKKYFCIYLPYWPAALFRQKLLVRSKSGHNQTPLVLVSLVSQQPVVKRFCRTAQSEGVKEDMPLAFAKALCPGAAVGNFTPYQDFRALWKAARHMLRFTPVAAVDNELYEAARSGTLPLCNPIYNGIILDITGTERLHKGEQNLAAKVLAELDRLGIKAKIGAAPTIGAAWALSRYGTKQFNATTQIKQDLARLPAAALRLQKPAVQALADVNIKQIEDLFSYPPKAMLRRFGYQLLQRLDQALGRTDEGFVPVHERLTYAASCRFLRGVSDSAALHPVLIKLVEEVLRHLSERTKKASSFAFVLKGVRPDCSHFEIHKELSLQTASGSMSHIAALLHYMLEALHPPGDIYEAHLEALQVQQSSQRQADFLCEGAVDRSAAAQELLDHLTIRLGSSRVCRAALKESHIPERSFQYQPCRESHSVGAGRKQANMTSALRQYAASDRPPCLLQPPKAIQAVALLPDQPPAWIKWGGERCRIKSGLGPERICAEWWRDGIQNAHQARDYFKVQDADGRWLWIFRDCNTREWFLHGLWT